MILHALLSSYIYKSSSLIVSWSCPFPYSLNSSSGWSTSSISSLICRNCQDLVEELDVSENLFKTEHFRDIVAEMAFYRLTSTSFQIFWHQSLRQFHLNLENFLWNLLYVTCLLVRARKHLFLAMGIVHTFDLICRSSSAHRGGVGSRSRPRPPGGWCHSSPPVSAPCAAAPQTLTCWTWSCSPAPRRATACKSRTTPRRRWPFTHPTHCCPPHPTPSHHSQHSS